MLAHISDCLAQAAVGFDLVLLDLLGQPVLKFGHLRAALGLMPRQPLRVVEAPAVEIGMQKGPTSARKSDPPGSHGKPPQGGGQAVTFSF